MHNFQFSVLVSHQPPTFECCHIEDTYIVIPVRHRAEILLYITLRYVRPNFVLLISTPEPRFSLESQEAARGTSESASWCIINGENLPGALSERETCGF